jgi:hypothetical protein
LECKDDRFSRFNFFAGHYHFSVTVWAPGQSTTKRGGELIFGDGGGCFIHGAIVVSSYFEMFKNKSSVPKVGMKADLRKREARAAGVGRSTPLLGVNRKSHFGTWKAAFDPKPTLSECGGASAELPKS